MENKCNIHFIRDEIDSELNYRTCFQSSSEIIIDFLVFTALKIVANLFLEYYSITHFLHSTYHFTSIRS